MLKSSYDLQSIAEVQADISEGKTTVQAVVKKHLDAIKELDPQLNSVTAVNENALEDAAALDRVEKDKRGPLFGVPIVIKDQIETAGIATTFGSKACKDFLPAKDATLVSKLRDAGAVILAKSTMPDWAASWFSTSSASGTTCNPYDLSRDPGGSSSGSGAAVAAGLAVVGIGGDTGGSIRLPSSFCGLVGVRVTPGRISRDGMSALLTPQDTPGPMARSVEDAARILDVIVAFDERDPYTSVNAICPLSKGSTPFLDSIKKPTLQGKRLGVLRQAFGTVSGINQVMITTLETLTAGGAQLVDVEVPDLEQFQATVSSYTIRSRADINGFLSSREQFAHLKIEDLHATGTYHKALDLIDAIVKGPADFCMSPGYAKALIEQGRFQRTVASIFAKNQLDAIVYPTCQLLPPKTTDLIHGRWSCLNYPTNTVIGSLLLFPAVSVPVGKAKDVEDGPDGPELPVGLEILGLPLREESLLAVAAGVEAAVRKR